MAIRQPIHIVSISTSGEEVFVACLTPGKNGGTDINTKQVDDAINPAVCLTGVLAIALLAPPEISAKLLSCAGALQAHLAEYYPDMLESLY